MQKKETIRTVRIAVGAGAAALIAGTTGAAAGGFELREQSTVFMGSAFAGAAAGGSLGSMYWNPASAAQLPGLNSESSYTLILPSADIHVNSIGGAPVPSPFADSGDIGIDAVTSASYGTYQLTDKLWVGMSLTSPFGLATKPENPAYAGGALGLTTKVLTLNATPTLAYRIAPGITVGAGVQIEYARGKLAFATGPGTSALIKGDDVGVGATAGITVEPAYGMTVGLGYRSGITHDLDGHFSSGATYLPAVSKLKLPDIVTLSVRQEITPHARLLGTVEWTNWSRFDNVTATTPGPTLTLPSNWNDGWFFSVGGEYDYSPSLTLRGGVAYEISPEDSPSKVLTAVPDGDRVLLSAGASYTWSAATTIDVGYTHVFVDSGNFVRSPIGNPTVFAGNFDASADLISVGMRTRW